MFMYRRNQAGKRSRLTTLNREICDLEPVGKFKVGEPTLAAGGPRSFCALTGHGANVELKSKMLCRLELGAEVDVVAQSPMTVIRQGDVAETGVLERAAPQIPFVIHRMKLDLVDLTSKQQFSGRLQNDLSGVVLGVLQCVKRHAGILVFRGQRLEKRRMPVVIWIAITAGEECAGPQPRVHVGNRGSPSQFECR